MKFTLIFFAASESILDIHFKESGKLAPNTNRPHLCRDAGGVWFDIMLSVGD